MKYSPLLRPTVKNLQIIIGRIHLLLEIQIPFKMNGKAIITLTKIEVLSALKHLREHVQEILVWLEQL